MTWGPVVLIAYLVGSVPFGLVLTKLFVKKDIRDIGSGNIGATNVLRTGNRTLAAFTLVLDLLKGAVAVLLFYPSLLHSSDFHSFALIPAIAVILGHCFPIWLKFKGGKGVATTLGVLLAAVPYAGVAACGAWLLSAFLFKISSLAALVATAIAPIVTFFVYGGAPAGICAIITLLVWARHKDNIRRLLNGTEPKIGQKDTKEKAVDPVSE